MGTSESWVVVVVSQCEMSRCLAYGYGKDKRRSVGSRGSGRTLCFTIRWRILMAAMFVCSSSSLTSFHQLSLSLSVSSWKSPFILLPVDGQVHQAGSCSDDDIKGYADSSPSALSCNWAAPKPTDVQRTSDLIEMKLSRVATARSCL